jgi:hypothetical protein
LDQDTGDAISDEDTTTSITDEGDEVADLVATVDDTTTTPDEDDILGVADENTVDDALTGLGTDTDTALDPDVTTTTTTGVAVPPAVPSEDSDRDGLTDEEEKLFGTLSEKPDTDGDSFADGDEVLLGYDPAVVGKTLAENTALMNVYANTQIGFSVMHPAEWTVRSIDGTANLFELSVVPDTSGDLISVSVQNNPGGLTAADFYAENANVLESTVQSVQSWAGATGVFSNDGYTAYYTDDNYVYIITYTYGTKTEVDYVGTFNMMVRSMELTGSQPATTTTTSAATADSTTGENGTTNSGTDRLLPGNDTGSLSDGENSALNE